MNKQISVIREALVLGIKAINHLGGAREAMPLHDAMPALTQLEAMVGEPVADINVRPSESGGTIASVFSHKLPVGSWLLYRAAPVAQQPQKLEDVEQYRMRMAGICTAAIGYWKEGDPIHPDYDTPALRDVAKLYAQYDALYKAQQPQARPDFTDEWAGYLKDGETPFERFLRERKDLQSLLKLYQRVLEENERLKAQQPQAEAVPVVTPAMVDAYLKANTAYWQQADELPKSPTKWINGTVQEATRVSLTAALAAAPQQAEAVPSLSPICLELSAEPGCRYKGLCVNCAAPQQAEAVPPGYVLVPVEPTEAMMDAAVQAICYGPEGGFTRISGPQRAWKAMIGAAIAQQKGQP